MVVAVVFEKLVDELLPVLLPGRNIEFLQVLNALKSFFVLIRKLLNVQAVIV